MRQTWRRRTTTAGGSGLDGTQVPAGDASAWRDLGRDALGAGEPAEALWFLRHAIEIDEDDPLSWELLGRCFEEMGAGDRARNCYKVAFRQQREQVGTGARATARRKPIEPHDS